MMALADRLLADEGLRLTVYDDATGKPIGPGSQVIGKPTIGIGTLICAPGGITADEARFLLDNRVQIAQKAADRLVPGLQISDPVRFDVLTEMSFQLGATGLAAFTNTLQAVRDKRWNDAAAGMLDSTWAKIQTPARAQALAAIMRSGQP
jgi:lysozyme